VPKFVKATPATVPLSAPVTVQVVVPPAGPFSVFEPAPPSKETAIPAEPSDESIVNVSSSLPPFTVRLEIDATGVAAVIPSIVTETSPLDKEAEIVCEEPFDAAIVSAGGARPLAVPDVGSGVHVVVPCGEDVAPSDCVDGAVPTPVPSVEEPDAPAADDVHAAEPALESEPVPVTLESVVVVDGVAVIVVSDDVSDVGATDESTVAESPVVPTVDGSLTAPVLLTEMVPGDPRTTVVCWAGADAFVWVWVWLDCSWPPPDVIVTGTELPLETFELPPDELVLPDPLGSFEPDVAVGSSEPDAEKNW
jgi:hypothetical protein